MVTITMSAGSWVAIMMMIFLGGKALQNGGVLYERGEEWRWYTLIGALFQIIPVLVIGIAALAGSSHDG